VSLATERIFRTAAGQLVPEDHPDAAFLAAGVGDPVPDGYEPKQAEKPANKAVKTAPNK
jgi:hypothetical protein